MKKIWIVCSALAIGALIAFLVFRDYQPSEILSQRRTTPPTIEPFLTAGKLAEGEQQFRDWLRNNPKDDTTRFGLGTLQVLRSVETLGQSLYRYGLVRNQFAGLFPIFIPVPENPNPQTLKYSDLNQIFQTLNTNMGQIRDSLAPIVDKSIKLRLRLGLAKIDLNGDGKIAEDEALWRLFSELVGTKFTLEQAQEFVISFDYGDVLWLQGYTHIFSGLTDFLLAYDRQELFNAGIHRFFAKPDTPYDFLVETNSENSPAQIADLITLIHLFRFPVSEPKRMESMRQHFLSTLRLSQESWQAILRETDDDREWLPNPKQNGIFPDIRITQEMIDRWVDFTKEGTELLEGRKLAPFWRVANQRGINLKLIFSQPTTFDLVTWLQGSGIAPFLEKGKPFTNTEIWNSLFDVFGGNILGFGLWFN